MSGRHAKPAASPSALAAPRDGQLNMITKPPKPPCWRDFVPDTGRTRRTTAITVERAGVAADLGRGGGSEMGERTARLHPRKHRIKLHRTQSELTIQQTHLPESDDMTVSLADTRPREFGLGHRSTATPVVVTQDENAARCERWLRGVHASQPLEDFVFARGAGVDVEVPEENLAALGRVALLRTESSSGSDVDSASVCAMRMRAMHGDAEHSTTNRNGRKPPPKHRLMKTSPTNFRHTSCGIISHRNDLITPQQSSCAPERSRVAATTPRGGHEGSLKENCRPSTGDNKAVPRLDACSVNGRTRDDNCGTRVHVYVTTADSATQEGGVHANVTAEDHSETQNIVRGYVTEDHSGTSHQCLEVWHVTPTQVTTASNQLRFENIQSRPFCI